MSAKKHVGTTIGSRLPRIVTAEVVSAAMRADEGASIIEQVLSAFEEGLSRAVAKIVLVKALVRR